MGNGSSFEVSRTIYLSTDGKREKIVFSRHMSNRDVHELIAVAANVDKHSVITLKNSEGSIVPVSPVMPSNTQSAPYTVHIRQPRQMDGNSQRDGKEDVGLVLSQVADQFNKVFKVEEMKSEFATRIQSLEKRLDKEGLKSVEIDKCRKDITDLKNQIYDAQKRFIDYNHMRPITTGGVASDRYFSSATDERKIGLKRDIPTYPKYTLSQETIQYLKQPTFDIWHWEPNEMLSLLEHMYHELGLVHEFNMNPITLKRWLLCVQENYRNNPFHNFRHCFCVTQMMYGMINLCELWEKMTREDLGIMLTAAICHDLDHPGYNNTYQINARTELAIRYNDISPLESHHCAVAFQILSNPECNIFSNVDEETFKRVRAGVVMLILATDMARHSEILEAFKVKLEDFDFANADHLNSLKMVIIKCCDISNEVRPMAVSEPWVDCLLEEYFNQSDRERKEGLPVAPFMDRDKVTKPTAQIGFIKFVLIPMFEQVAKLFPKLGAVMVEPLKSAHSHYEEMKNRTDAAKEAMVSTRDKKSVPAN